MYGTRNPVLRHFGADELALQATLHAIDERRQQGEIVTRAEEAVPRPVPEYDDYFEFNVPVQSGIGQGTRDLLVEEALGMATTPRRTEGEAGAFLGAGPSTSTPVPAAIPSSLAESPRRGSYNSTPATAYQSGGYASGGSSPGSPDVSPFNYGRSSYGQQRPSRPAVQRSTDSREATPRRSYEDGPTIQQPPFRAGSPVSGPVRRPGMTGTPSTPGSRRRPTSASPDGARNRSAATSPLRPESSAASGADPHRQLRQEDSAAVGSSGEGPVRVRGIGAKISGRPATAGSPRPSPGGVGASGRRPVSASPAAGARASGSAAVGRAAGGGAGGRSPYRAPAWAPTRSAENMRRDEVDEAARVALMLNDPGTSRDAGQDSGAQEGGAASPAGDQASPGQQRQPDQEQDVSSPRVTQGEATFHASAARKEMGTSPGYGQQTRSSLVSEQYFEQYRLRKHRETLGVPDHRFSQPRSYGAHAPVPQRYFSFDEAHPAIAEQHYARSTAQENMLQTERRRMQEAKMRAARAAARSKATASGPTTRQLASDVDRLMRVREAGRARLRQLERQGEALRQETQQIQQRAMDAIAKSERITASTGLRSRSPSASPTPRRSRTPSRASYYSGAGGYGGGGGAYITDAYSRSPSPARSHHRPHSASPSAAEEVSYQYSYADEGASYAEPSYTQEDSRAYYSGSEAGGSQHGSGQPPSSPPPPLPVSPPPGPSEALEILELLNRVERPHQEARDTSADDSSSQRRRRVKGEQGPEADHLARASAVASKRGPMGLLDEDEQRIAVGAYDRSRYEEYQRQVDLEMQRRAIEGGYDSDIDREDAANMLVRDPEQEAAEAEEARRRAEEERWRHENEWMDEYRRRFGPEDGYLSEGAVSAGGSADGGGGAYHGSALHAQRSVLLDADEELLREPYVPMVSSELSAGYASEGPSAYHRRGQRAAYHKTTVPQPFHFEEREKTRQKPIAQVKMEQDLALRRAEEEAARKRHFRASPVPVAVVEPRYERMLMEQEVKRQLSHQQRLEELASLVEKPFSFYYRDQERQAEREALARAAKDPNRFQTGFRARDAPAHTKEERLKAMLYEMEAKREATRQRVEEARRLARERAEEEAQRRREAANRAYQERLRSVDPAVHKGPHPSRPMGVVPDFNSLHRQHEIQMARARANIRKRVTVPQEFKLNGVSPDEQAEREHKAQERRHRIILDMQVDAELLPEMRWPYKSPRGKVRRTPPPAYLVDWMARSPGNHAANVRKSLTTVAAREGAYQTREEREAVARKASEKLRAEALKRADRLLKASLARKQQEAAAAAAAGGEQDFGLLSDVGATAAGGADQSSSGRGGAVRRRAAVAGRQDNPEVYVEARHMQIERRVREVVEDALLDQGIEAYRYVEGVGGGSKKGKGNARQEDA